MVAYRGILTGLTKSTDHPSMPEGLTLRARISEFMGAVEHAACAGKNPRMQYTYAQSREAAPG